MSLCAIHQPVTSRESYSLVILFQPKGRVAERVMDREGPRQCVAQCSEVPALDALGVRGMGWWKSGRWNLGRPSSVRQRFGGAGSDYKPMGEREEYRKGVRAGNSTAVSPKLVVRQRQDNTTWRDGKALYLRRRFGGR